MKMIKAIEVWFVRYHDMDEDNMVEDCTRYLNPDNIQSIHQATDSYDIRMINGTLYSCRSFKECEVTNSVQIQS